MFTIPEWMHNQRTLQSCPQHPKVINIGNNLDKKKQTCLSPAVHCGPICMALCLEAPSSQTKTTSIIYLDLLPLTRLCTLTGPLGFLPNLSVLEKRVHASSQHSELSLHQIRTRGELTPHVVSPQSWNFHL